MSDISHAIPAAKGQVHGHSAGVFFRSIVIALTAFLSLVDLFATQAILPMLTEHYGVTPGQMGLASNASTLGMLVSGLAVGYFSSSIDRRRGILHQPRSALDPDGAARLRTKPHRLCDSAHPARPVHGLGLHPHPCLSRRALQRAGFGLGLCRLHHRQRCEQSDRTADLGRRRRSFRARRQFLFLRAAQSRRRAARLFHRGEDPADEKRRAGHGLAFLRLDHAPQEPVLARELRHRLLHPVRVHRHLHLRELRPGAATLQRRRHDARHHLFRVPARHRHHPACRPRRETLRHAGDLLGLACRGRARPAA